MAGEFPVAVWQSFCKLPYTYFTYYFYFTSLQFLHYNLQKLLASVVLCFPSPLPELCPGLHWKTSIPISPDNPLPKSSTHLFQSASNSPNSDLSSASVSFYSIIMALNHILSLTYLLWGHSSWASDEYCAKDHEKKIEERNVGTKLHSTQ